MNGASRVDTGVRVSKFVPDESKVVLTNGKEYTYKSLVLAPGFDHKVDNIEGLRSFEDEGEQSGVFSHVIDTKARMDRNYWHGQNHHHGDMIVYNPAFPYKDEGMNFYAFYYEHLLRNDKLVQRAAADARVQIWTPNKELFKFDYANQFALEECEKRLIDVNFGWEMMKVYYNDIGEKVCTFRNVDTNET